MNTYTIKPIANGNKGLFYNDSFCGLYSATNEVSNFSGNKGQIFDVNTCANFLLQNHSEVYSSVDVAGHQFHLRVTTKPHILTQGILTKHIGTFASELDLINYCNDNNITDYIVNKVDDNYFASIKQYKS